MTVGPERPVLSWSWESFSAMEMRGASITCREEREGSELQSTTCSLPTPHPPAARSAQNTPSSALLTKALFWAHSLSSGTSDRRAVLRENPKLQWCCCHPPCAVSQTPLHVSTRQVNPKFSLLLSEWEFSVFLSIMAQ